MTDDDITSTAVSEAISVYEDWQQRRREIDEKNADGPTCKLLDYLLSRYAADPQASRPAMFPRIRDVELNGRAMIVHRHLASRSQLGQTSKPRTRKRGWRNSSSGWPSLLTI